VFILEQSLFTLQDIDNNISRLDITIFDGDKLSPRVGVSLSVVDSNLHQHGKIVLLLECNFCLILSSHCSHANVDIGSFRFLCHWTLFPDDKNWENFLCFLEIMDKLFAYRISEEQCGYLKALIGDHHSSFKELYPDASITMKLHSLIYVPRIILK